MKRRSLLKLGLGAAVLVGVAGGGIALMKPGLVDNKLSPDAQALMRAVALATLDGVWPADAAKRDADLTRHIAQLDVAIAALPQATRGELSQLLALLTSGVGRRTMAGLAPDWKDASAAEVAAAMQDMRFSSLAPRQQIYQALRELNCVVFFAESSHWGLVGYPGPREIA